MQRMVRSYGYTAITIRISISYQPKRVTCVYTRVQIAMR